MRSLAINYMCLLSDKDLRIAGSKHITEIMYELFKSCYNNFVSYETTTKSSSQDTLNCSTNNNENNSNSQSEHNLVFKADRDGLNLAFKYFTSSTLTIRLCGIAQMNVKIKAI